MGANQHTSPGQAYPLGAQMRPGGVNFSIFSKNCTALELLLFDDADQPQPSRVIPLDPRVNKTFYYWHVFVPGIGAGQLYGYRAYGPYAPERGLRFDSGKVLVDPYTKVVMVGEKFDRRAATGPGDNCAQALKSVVADLRGFNWEGDKPIKRPYSGSVIYEMHVGGFTRHPSSGVAPERRGTYLGVIDKIPYLKELGVTAVELMPVQQFDEQHAPEGLRNYWGYSPVAFFAPHRGYSSDRSPLGPLNEFREMVKALHRAGIEVILDVVFNHTAEGDLNGPTYSFRGLENRAYYMLDPANPARYLDFSGVGHTLDANHSITRRLILDCLRYWVESLHVDGFRFDLASVMARDSRGEPFKDPPILWEIESDPVLASAKIIAEAWDAGGLYQVGSFIGHRWSEWNGRFRDDARRFVRGDQSTASALAYRLTGSPDLYNQPDREPNRSINFVTCHDGFTLNDLVSFNRKHNLFNNENSRDGMDENFSWNCGYEGPEPTEEVETLRRRQVRNLLTILFVSQGTPMLLMGDEVRRTQHGNNNAYCQDNEISWLDWSLLDTHADLLRFVKHLIRFTQAAALFREEQYWTASLDSAWLPDRRLHTPRLAWHGVRLNRPDFAAHSHSLALELFQHKAGEHAYVAINAYWEPLSFEIPPLPPAQTWRRVIDTALPSPYDIQPPAEAPLVSGREYLLAPRSTVLLWAQAA